MSGYFGAVLAIVQAEAQRRQEEQFYEALRDVEPGVAAQLIADRKAAEEKARLEAIEERRHQELCAAIRQSGGAWWR